VLLFERLPENSLSIAIPEMSLLLQLLSDDMEVINTLTESSVASVMHALTQILEAQANFHEYSSFTMVYLVQHHHHSKLSKNFITCSHPWQFLFPSSFHLLCPPSHPSYLPSPIFLCPTYMSLSTACLAICKARGHPFIKHGLDQGLGSVS